MSQIFHSTLRDHAPVTVGANRMLALKTNMQTEYLAFRGGCKSLFLHCKDNEANHRTKASQQSMISCVAVFFSMARFCRCSLGASAYRVMVLLGLYLTSSLALATPVTVAGFAFAGEYKSAAARFPYTFKLFERQKSTGDARMTFSNLVIERSKEVKNPRLEFLPGAMVNLKDGDQALMAVLMLTGETVSVEDFGTYHKMFVNLRGDALIFDYKAQTILRSCPVSVVLFDATPTRPSESRITGFVDDLIRRSDGRGLVTQFTRCLERTDLSALGTHTVQVRRGEVAPEALALLPDALRMNPATVEAMLADGLGSILSAKAGVSMLPSSIGHAVGGVMTMRLENGDDYKLKLGEGDYVFDVKLNKLAKIKTGESNVGVSYVYGAYIHLRFTEPTLNTVFIDTDLKNGEVAVIPVGQVTGDDFSAYQDAVRGVFLKLSDALLEPGSKWITTSASAKDIEAQLNSARTILNKCK